LSRSAWCWPPNGDLLATNDDAGNTSNEAASQASALTEFAPTGQFVGQLSLHPGAGTASGLVEYTHGHTRTVASVDDVTNNWAEQLNFQEWALVTAHVAVHKQLGTPDPATEGAIVWRATQLIVGLVGVVALATAGFFAGLVSGPRVLSDLDLDVYVFNPVQRVYHWAFLCSLGFGLIGAAILLALADHSRKFQSFRKGRSTAGLKTLLGLLALVSLPALFAWAAVFSPHEPAVRSRCINNLKAIALALHAYHDDFGCFPPAYVPDESGRAKHSWRVLILPYLDRAAFSETSGLKRLYDTYDFSEPWDGPHNRRLAHQMPLLYGCGDDPARRSSTTSYLVITGDHSAFPDSRSIKLEEIRDGRANTIIVIETGNSGINWMEPKDYPIEELRFGPKDGGERRIGGNHPGGAKAGFADGSVRFLREQEITNETLKALGTIDKGEKIDHGRW
jgi:Protein of unknown function (DUF1559)